MSLSMMSGGPFVAHAFAWSVPLVYAVSAWVCRAPARAHPWRFAQRAALLAAASAAGALLLALAAGVAALGATMLLLVSTIAAVIVLFSRRYMAGEPGLGAYRCALFETLAAVSLVVAASNLLLLALAWACSSGPLRRLLLFYGERPAAQTAARKMLVFARIADALVLAANGLLAWAFGSLDIGVIVSRAAGAAALPPAAGVAALLLALGVLLKSAQLPFHGWLIQVMEAPTPVSALLHAGVVNLGGFVLMRFAPLIDAVPAARVLLVVVGGLTAAAAALVASTRISIKVSLAWSTCAQMGFMLAECGMGWWAAALLHLLAHSLYKAHAFLASGNAVRDAVVAQMTTVPRRPSALSLFAGAAVSVAAVAGGLALLATHEDTTAPGLWILVAGLTWMGLARPLGWASVPGQVMRVAALVAVALALHAAVARLLLPAIVPVEPPIAARVALAVAWALLCAVQMGLWLALRSAWMRRLYPWVYGGLYLDAWVSRWLAAPALARSGSVPRSEPLISLTGAR